MADLIPTFSDLSLYDKPESQTARYQNLVHEYKDVFQGAPEFIARAPGRVNLIGDHIDYCYFSVLPMAIEYDVIEAIGKSSDSKGHFIHLANTDKRFTPETIELPKDGSIIVIDKDSHSWTNYYRCSLIVAQNYLWERFPNSKGQCLKSINVVIDGTVPTGGGLSSSAALCVASTLGILKANGVENITKKDLTRITVVSEHYVGLNNGGMDQCASVCGEKGKVLFIEFQPELRATPYSIPEIHPPLKPLSFLITNTLVESNKNESAPVNYNLRVVEMAIGAEFLARLNGITLPKNSNLNTGTLRGFMDTYFVEKKHLSRWNGRDIGLGIQRLQELSQKIETWFTDSQKIGFTTEEAANRLGLSNDEFTEKYLTTFPVKYEKLKIYQRTKHVFDEARRVLETLRLFTDSNASENSSNFLKRFGEIMDQSQLSLKTLLMNSTDECDELCRIARKNGSLGSRITGAGWGGSLVHFTTEDKLDGLINALVEQYYKKHFPNITEEEISHAVVVTKPAVGSCIVNQIEF